MTHADLVARAARWLTRSCRCRVVLTERGVSEIPDAIGWHGRGVRITSYVVECKVSRADFQADQRKQSRSDRAALGRHRFYLTPPGLIDAQQLPALWGLLEAYPSRIVIRKRSFGFETTPERMQNERALLVNELAIYHANGIGYPTLTGRAALPHLEAFASNDDITEARRLMRLEPAPETA